MEQNVINPSFLTLICRPTDSTWDGMGVSLSLPSHQTELEGGETKWTGGKRGMRQRNE